ncbi:MAG: pyridoxamine 5'-phosphate oxidase family protein [Pseudomonadota bacterium]
MTTPTSAPWHAGEVAMQQTVGVAERMAVVGSKVVRDFMPDQHRDFYEQLPFIVMGAVDPQGDAWATFAIGNPGFLSSPDPRTLEFAFERDPLDPADSGLDDGAAVGLLGIELHTRRRNRMNGTLRRSDARSHHVQVSHSFGNCPQYIQLRDFRFVRNPAQPSLAPPEEIETLHGRPGEMVAAADTFFVASYVDTGSDRQVDVSHRGGKAGFVRINADGTLTIPDFAGNLHFNTLGNFLVNPRAGLIFADFATGDVLQMTGRTEVVLDSPEIAAFQGAERLWTFRPRRIVLRRGALALRWAMREKGWSPNSLMTGDWQAAAQRIEAEALTKSWRPFIVTDAIDESATIRSFHLQPQDGKGLIAHKAGQHLPIRVTLPGDTEPSLRTYTLSCAPSDGGYRISVKRDGRVSQFLHDRVATGATLEAKGPTGTFTIDAAERRPAVLVAAGVGITPMLAMLRHIVFEGIRTRTIRQTWMIQTARNKAERAFDAEINALAEAAQGAVRVIRIVSQPGPDERTGRDHQGVGRLTADSFRQILPFGDYDFYLCGPGGFMQDLYDGLRDLNVADQRIHAEAFGPSALARRSDPSAEAAPQPQAAESSVSVVFTASGKEARWHPEGGSLLELAESRGLKPEHSCRAGSCGSCAVRLLKGRVAYPVTPTAPVGPDEILICSAVPAAGSETLEIEL